MDKENKNMPSKIVYSLSEKGYIEFKDALVSLFKTLIITLFLL
ncbi:hypothetical protein [Clostridioides sp. ZZV15-6598]|nr:hypothetical protein NZ312_02530 [Clostridioides difficile]